MPLSTPEAVPQPKAGGAAAKRKKMDDVPKALPVAALPAQSLEFQAPRYDPGENPTEFSEQMAQIAAEVGRTAQTRLAEDSIVEKGGDLTTREKNFEKVAEKIAVDGCCPRASTEGRMFARRLMDYDKAQYEACDSDPKREAFRVSWFKRNYQALLIKKSHSKEWQTVSSKHGTYMVFERIAENYGFSVNQKAALERAKNYTEKAAMMSGKWIKWDKMGGCVMFLWLDLGFTEKMTECWSKWEEYSGKGKVKKTKKRKLASVLPSEDEAKEGAKEEGEDAADGEVDDEFGVSPQDAKKQNTDQDSEDDSDELDHKGDPTPPSKPSREAEAAVSAVAKAVAKSKANKPGKAGKGTPPPSPLPPASPAPLPEGGTPKKPSQVVDQAIVTEAEAKNLRNRYLGITSRSSYLISLIEMDHSWAWANNDENVGALTKALQSMTDKIVACKISEWINLEPKYMKKQFTGERAQAMWNRMGQAKSEIVRLEAQHTRLTNMHVHVVAATRAEVGETAS